MNLKLMKYLCGLNQDILQVVLQKFLITKGYKVVIKDEYLYAEGTDPVCLVAHLDTVFKQLPSEIYYDKEQHVMWSPQGLGADDRAGIYAILQIVNDGYKPTIVFCKDEEVGGLGAQALVEDMPECPTELKMIIELDRQGMDDCVFYDCDNPDFERYIQQFGFTPDMGSFSDISFIAPEWKVAAVNLSVGYMNEHTYCETLYTNWLEDTIAKVETILDSIGDMPSFEYIPLVATFIPECMICRAPLHVNNFKPVFLKGMQINVCNECLDKYYRPDRNEALNF